MSSPESLGCLDLISEQVLQLQMSRRSSVQTSQVGFVLAIALQRMMASDDFGHRFQYTADLGVVRKFLKLYKIVFQMTMLAHGALLLPVRTTALAVRVVPDFPGCHI
mmetsp:Transcript_1001/g.1493  ORF Transcript_1001/g.1493 Transcript_1001/m.1493 type:complete len:107 (+) Transcript_1001:1041-1361(+)